MAAATLEQRVTSLEQRMSEMEGQVGFLIPVVRQVHLDLIGFKEDVDARFTSLENRFTSLENKVDRMDDKFTRKFGELDSKVNRLDAKVNGLDVKVDAMPRAVAEIVAGLIKKYNGRVRRRYFLRALPADFGAAFPAACFFAFSVAPASLAALCFLARDTGVASCCTTVGSAGFWRARSLSNAACLAFAAASCRSLKPGSRKAVITMLRSVLSSA
jgi:uncharacterized coiled-coil protein SlyX